jgi:FKBP-type peptidyl-prolyl cis-trans isomerase SlyD
MEVTNDRVVTMNYKLTGPEGNVLDTSEGREPLTYLHGHKNIIPGLEKRLEGTEEGAKLTVEVPAAEAYGEHDPQNVVKAQRDQFPDDAQIEPGARFEVQGPQGRAVVRVVEAEGEEVTLDANHPLAGTDLTFEVEVLEVREANEEEVEHGHVHGEGGVQH